MKKLLISIITLSIIIPLFSSSITIADTSSLTYEIENMVSDVYSIQNPVERLKTIKSTIKNEAELKKRILFARWAVSYWLKMQRDEALKRQWLENLESYTYIKTVDWDTINIYNAFWNKVSVRMIGIDAPESSTLRFWYKECYWDEAKNYLNNLIWDTKYVSAEIDSSQWEYDKYWRKLLFIWKDWVNVNQELIKQGFWYEYTYNKPYKYQSEFLEAQNYAQTNENGLWAINTCNWERTPVIAEKSYSCENKRYCSEMTSCDEAKYYLNTCWYTRLDSDDDWIPCEALCN